MKHFLFITAAVASLAAPVFAQEPTGVLRVLEPHFFVALVAGVILATAFQLFLTNFSGAIGLSAARMFTHKKRKVTREESRKEAREEAREEAKESRERERGDISDQVHSSLRNISAGFGVMTLITASIALFFASWFAVEIAGPVNLKFALILALSIWGISYIISVSLELLASSTMVGAIAKVAKQSIQSLAESTYGMLGRSEAKKDADRAREITQAVRGELFGKMDVRRQIKDFIREIRPDGPREYRRELETLLNELHIEDYVSPNAGPGGMQAVIHEIRTSGSPMTKERARNATGTLREAASRAREEYQSDRPASEKMVMGAMRAAGMSPEEAEDSRRKIEGFLRSTEKSALEPEGIKRDLEQLFQDPSQGTEALKKRLSAIDRDTIETILAKRQDMNRDEVHQKVDRIWGMVESLRGRAEEVRGKVAGGAESARQRGSGTRERALDKIEDYLENLERPGIDPEAIRNDLELLFHDPKAGAGDLYDRMKHLSRDDIMAIVTTNRYISREDAEGLVDRIMEVRDRIMEQAEYMKKEVQYRIDQAQREMLHQADQVRKTLASATWWVFLTALVSGITAALGGWTAFLV